MSRRVYNPGVRGGSQGFAREIRLPGVSRHATLRERQPLVYTMKLPFALLTTVVLSSSLGTLSLLAGGETALADSVVKASGGAQWPSVKHVQFTFQVEQPGKAEPLVTAKHDWDVAGNKDTVTWGGKTVTIDLGAANDTGDQKAAFARWTNDSYWLLAPLKLRDKGVHLEDGGKETVAGKSYGILKVSFDKVGMTNNDHYNVYVDPETNLPAHWDYMPAPDKKVSGTWEKYVEVGGLTLSTDHHFGDKEIRLLDLKVE